MDVEAYENSHRLVDRVRLESAGCQRDFQWRASRFDRGIFSRIVNRLAGQMAFFEPKQVSFVAAWASGVCLGLGVGAKLFPIVLFPALLVSSARVGWSRGLLFGAAFSAAAGLSLYPMYHSINHAEQNDERRAVGQSVSEDTTEQTPPIHKKEESTPQADDVNPFGPQLPGKKEGLTSFLSRWRMNDVIFSGIYENFKPTLVAKSDLPDDQRFPAWYVISTPEFRSWAKQQWESRFPDSSNWAFSMARVLTLGPFCLFYLWQLVAIYRRRPAPESEGEESTSLEFNRLVWILVLFLFLQPTVNPWYWVWVAPLTLSLIHISEPTRPY